jgi:hypothetical protein
MTPFDARRRAHLPPGWWPRAEQTCTLLPVQPRQVPRPIECTGATCGCLRSSEPGCGGMAPWRRRLSDMLGLLLARRFGEATRHQSSGEDADQQGRQRPRESDLKLGRTCGLRVRYRDCAKHAGDRGAHKQRCRCRGAGAHGHLCEAQPSITVAHVTWPHKAVKLRDRQRAPSARPLYTQHARRTQWAIRPALAGQLERKLRRSGEAGIDTAIAKPAVGRLRDAV